MALNGEMRLLSHEDVEAAFQLETEGYPSDAAAPYDVMSMRQEKAPQLFLGYFEDSSLIGFVCATRAASQTLTKESMSSHDPEGESVCIHSVCVHEDRRRQGIAMHMLKHFVQHVKDSQSGLKRILLVCEDALIPLYSKAGFVFVSKSALVHGAETWYEMSLVVDQ